MSDPSITDDDTQLNKMIIHLSRHTGLSFGQKLGEGSFGSVLKAIMKVDGADWPVAVKFVRKRGFAVGEENHLQNEQNIMWELKHPHILACYNVVDLSTNIQNRFDFVYFVLELVKESLDDKVKREHIKRLKGGLSVQEMKKIFVQLIGALHFLDKKHICHRDIKPTNVLLDAKDDVKLADFGFAIKLLPHETSSVDCGTPGYKAPEVGKHPYHGRPADVFSLGALMFYCATGRHAFGEGQKRAKFPSWWDLPDLAKIILACFKPTPVDRPSYPALLSSEFLKTA